MFFICTCTQTHTNYFPSVCHSRLCVMSFNGALIDRQHFVSCVGGINPFSLLLSVFCIQLSVSLYLFFFHLCRLLPLTVSIIVSVIHAIVFCLRECCIPDSQHSAPTFLDTAESHHFVDTFPLHLPYIIYLTRLPFPSSVHVTPCMPRLVIDTPDEQLFT